MILTQLALDAAPLHFKQVSQVTLMKVVHRPLFEKQDLTMYAWCVHGVCVCVCVQGRDIVEGLKLENWLGLFCEGT